MSDQIGKCCICSPENIENSKLKHFFPAGKSVVINRLMKCLNCNNLFCNDCISGLHSFITKTKLIPQEIKGVDVTVRSIKNMNAMSNSSSSPSVQVGPCCSFKMTIPKETRTSTTKIPFPPVNAIQDSKLLCKKRKLAHQS